MQYVPVLALCYTTWVLPYLSQALQQGPEGLLLVKHQCLTSFHSCRCVTLHALELHQPQAFWTLLQAYYIGQDTARYQLEGPACLLVTQPSSLADLTA